MLHFMDWRDKRREYSYKDDERPCLLCERPVKYGKGVQVGLDDTQSYIVKPEDSTSFFSIGPDCYKKHKAELEPFIVK